MPFEELVKHLKGHDRIEILGAHALEERDDGEARLKIYLNVSLATPTDLKELHAKLQKVLGRNNKLPVLAIADNLHKPKEGQVELLISSPISQLAALRFKAMLLNSS